MSNIRVAIDAMGGDHGVNVTVPAAVDALQENTNLSVTLVGQKSLIEDALSSFEFTDKKYMSRLSIHNTTQVVGMDELPSHALRGKKDSSMRVAINQVKEGVAHACVSAGNTGALMAISRFVLKMLVGVDRPAIMFRLPTMDKPVQMLDLGANVDCHADHLFQFAVMGSVVSNAVYGRLSPKVGLLNVGSESIKGTEQVKRAAELLRDAKGINFVGFIEGDDIYKGKVDVVVCDGFVGNVALKTSEGLARMILHYAKQDFSKNLFTKFAGLCAKPVLKSLFNRFDANQYNGGSLLGLQGVVIKSHGGANRFAFKSAINVAIMEVEKNIPKQIKDLVATMLGEYELV